MCKVLEEELGDTEKKKVCSLPTRKSPFDRGPRYVHNEQ